jgi:peptide/nickel transport system ATP-binding protein
LVQPTSGAIALEGTQVYPPPDRRAYRAPLTMQMVFQDPYASLNPRMRVEDLVAEAIDVGFDKDRKARRESIVAELLERVGIDPSLKDRFPHQFSGGQRQRIAIARALAAQPRVLICDEAVSSLDVSIRAHVLNVLIQERLENHLSIVFIGHDLTVVRHLADRVIVMHNGAVVEEGTAEDVIFRPVDDYTKKLVQASALHALDTTRIPQPSTAIGTGGTNK